VAKRIKWSKRSRKDRLEIFQYWTDRNKSKTYSKKLKQLFNDSINRASKSPESGTPTDLPNVKIKMVKDYLLFYSIEPDFIEVITIWDSSRDPKKFSL